MTHHGEISRALCISQSLLIGVDLQTEEGERRVSQTKLLKYQGYLMREIILVNHLRLQGQEYSDGPSSSQQRA